MSDGESGGGKWKIARENLKRSWVCAFERGKWKSHVGKSFAAFCLLSTQPDFVEALIEAEFVFVDFGGLGMFWYIAKQRKILGNLVDTILHLNYSLQPFSALNILFNFFLALKNICGDVLCRENCKAHGEEKLLEYACHGVECEIYKRFSENQFGSGKHVNPRRMMRCNDLWSPFPDGFCMAAWEMSPLSALPSSSEKLLRHSDDVKHFSSPFSLSDAAERSTKDSLLQNKFNCRAQRLKVLDDCMSLSPSLVSRLAGILLSDVQLQAIKSFKNFF